MVKSSLDGEVFAFSEMVDQMNLLREFYESFVDLRPGIVGLKDCDSLLAHLREILAMKKSQSRLAQAPFPSFLKFHRFFSRPTPPRRHSYRLEAIGTYNSYNPGT